MSGTGRALLTGIFVVEGGLRVPLEPEQLEPIGQRLVEVPKSPSRSLTLDPHYIVRQLYDVQCGARSGKTVELMTPIAPQLSLQEMIDIAAYVASNMP